MNNAYLQTVLWAAIGGSATSLASVVSDEDALQRPRKLLGVALAGAIIGVAALFKQKPGSGSTDKQDSQ